MFPINSYLNHLGFFNSTSFLMLYFYSTIVAFGLSYIGWVFYIAYAGGFWVYPVLEHLDDRQRILFILVCAIFMVVLYMIGEGCNYLVWGSTSKDSKSSQGTNIKNRESKKNKVPMNKRKYY